MVMGTESELTEIENLLNTATASLEGQWESLDDGALAEQIAKYRTALTDISKRLANLGTAWQHMLWYWVWLARVVPG